MKKQNCNSNFSKLPQSINTGKAINSHINYVQEVDSLRKKLIFEERAKYLRGEGQSLTGEEVKDRAINKKQRICL